MVFGHATDVIGDETDVHPDRRLGFVVHPNSAMDFRRQLPHWPL
jgi:hypothetical protein